MKKLFYCLTVLFSINHLSSQNSRIWATYYGGTGTDASTASAIDASGNIYIAGFTNSTSGISSGGHQNIYGGGGDDAFVAKFDAAGNRLWATYYGGTGNEGGFGIAVDGSGNVYLAGITDSPSNIASGGFQNAISSPFDAFLVKFNSNGVRQWATYYGGTGDEQLSIVTCDPFGNVYLGGNTTSTNSIASGGFQNTYGGGVNDAYLVKFDASGSRIWSTYYGGPGTDQGLGVTSDNAGNIYLTGQTNSTVSIASGGFQNTYGGSSNDCYIVKFSPSGARLWASYYGGSNADIYPGVATDNLGNIYLGGQTASSSGIASGGFQNTLGGSSDAFLVKFDPNGNRIWATYYGGPSGEFGGGPNRHKLVATDNYNNVYLSSNTQSTIGISSGGFQNSFAGVYDAFLVKFDALGNRIGATYYGGSADDFSEYVNVDSNGKIYIGGETASTSSISSAGFQNTFGGSYDAYLVKFDSPCTIPSIPGSINGLNSICIGSGIHTYSIPFVAGATSYSWSLPSGWSGSSTTNTISATTGTTSGNISVTASNACGTSSASVLSVTVNPLPTITASSSNSIICGPPYQGTATINASGASTYTWNTSATTASISVSPSVTTTYTVNGTSAAGCTNTATFTQSVSACTSISQISTINNQLIVYPNPFSNIITILSGGGKQSITIYNVLGELIHTEITEQEKTEINLNQIPSGIYFIKTSSSIQKIIKN